MMKGKLLLLLAALLILLFTSGCSEEPAGSVGPEEPVEPGQSNQTIENSLGLQVLAMTPQIAGSIGVAPDTKGVVIAAVDPNSDAARKGLRRADIILSANYKDVASIDALLAQVNAAKTEHRDAILLRIQRRGQPPAFVPVRMR
jgi:serine protease Do